MNKQQFREYFNFSLISILLSLIFISLTPVYSSSFSDWADSECIENNFTYSQCGEFINSAEFQKNFTYQQSDETQLIEDTKEELQDEFNDNIQELKDEISTNFTLVNNKFDNLDFSIYNDSKTINELDKKYQDKFTQFENKLNKFTGNTTTFDLNSIIQTQTQLYVAKETQKQIKSIFEDEEENKDQVNLTNYVTFNDLNSRLNSINSNEPINNNYANKNQMYLAFLLIIGGLVAFYYKIFKPMEKRIQNLQKNSYVNLPQEPTFSNTQKEEETKNDNPFSNKN